jgi:hypothetical protein
VVFNFLHFKYKIMILIRLSCVVSTLTSLENLCEQSFASYQEIRPHLSEIDHE